MNMTNLANILLLLSLLLPVAAGLGIYFLRLKGKTLDRATMAALSVTALLSLCLAFFGNPGEMMIRWTDTLSLQLRLDQVSRVYLALISVIWPGVGLYAAEYLGGDAHKPRFYLFYTLTQGVLNALAVSGNLVTFYMFYEAMTLLTVPLVLHDMDRPAVAAAIKYLIYSVLGASAALIGIFFVSSLGAGGDFAAGPLTAEMLAGKEGLAMGIFLVMLIGFSVKAGMFPLHGWLPTAHPVAPAPASALLSGMLTKTGLFGLIAIGLNLMGQSRVFGQVMLALGLITMLLGAVLAVFSINLKRILACSSLSQIGYITVGFACVVLLGENGAMAAAGTVGHMINHSLLKLALFLGAGAVYMGAHSLDLTRLMGYGRKKPLLHGVFLLGGMGLSGVPFLNGYASKTMIHEALVELTHEYPGMLSYHAAEWVFLFAAGLTAAYMLKIYLCLFWQKNPDAEIQKQYDGMRHEGLEGRSALALMLSVLPLLAIGLFPNQVLLGLTNISAPFLHQQAQGSIHFLSWANLSGGLISLAIGTAVYFLFVRTVLYRREKGYINLWPRRLDLEEIVYRPVFCRFLPYVGCKIAGFLDALPESRAITRYLAGLITGFFRLMDETMDHVMLFIRELFLINRQELHREGKHSIFTHLASAIVEGLHKALYSLSPRRRLHAKAPTDMRYGAYVTNAISFGLLLCALGIVAAIVYVFIRVGG